VAEDNQTVLTTYVGRDKGQSVELLLKFLSIGWEVMHISDPEGEANLAKIDFFVLVRLKDHTV
jgi:hypothetical protein